LGKLQLNNFHLMFLRYITMPSFVFLMTSPNRATVLGWKQTLASMASGYIDLELVCVSFLRWSNIAVIWTRSPMGFCIICLFTSRSSLMDICLNCILQSPAWNDSCTWSLWVSWLVGSHAISPRSSGYCINMHMRPECWKWKRWAVCNLGRAIELFLSPNLPLALSSFPIQVVPLCITLTIHARKQ